MKSTSRRTFLKSLGLASLSLGARRLARAQGAASPPNVLFILTDDQRFDTIHALGNKEIITPNVDSLVRGGTTFQNAYIMGGTSGAVCMPSRAMLNTGRGLYHLSEGGKTVAKDHTLLGEVFRKAGYETFGTGKWHNGREAYARSFTHGGHIMFGGMSEQYATPLNDFDPAGAYPQDKIYKPADREELKGKHSSTIYADTALHFLQTRSADKPFYMYVALQSPHDPRTAPQRFHDMYDSAKLPVPENFLPEHPFKIGDFEIRDEKLAPWPRTPEIVQKNMADYYAMITHDDYELGRIFADLKERGLYDNTIIVFTGDNGLALGRHGLFGKQNVYEHSVHVPLIFVGPGVGKSKKRDTLCYLIDIFPTLCELTGQPIPDSVDGKSLVPAIENRNVKHRDALVFAYKDFERALRTERYKLIYSTYKGEDHVQLFDLQRDPFEMKNLADDPEYSKTLDKLTRQLAAMTAELGDTAKIGEPGFGTAPSEEWTDKQEQQKKEKA